MTMSEQLTYLALWIEENWPALAIMGAGFWGVIVWLKRQFIDNVYATKTDLSQTKMDLEAKMSEHEQRDSERYETLTNVVNDNHDEIKDLIIKHLAKE